MQLSERQEKILSALVTEYLDHAMPISSGLLKKRCSLTCSPATVRNDLQTLAESGYISQPHTSAGRIPTNKAYRYFVDKLFGKQEETVESLIFKQVEEARERIEEELRLAKELTESLTEISITLSRKTFHQKDSVLEILEIIGPSKTSYDKNISIINKLLEELENF